MIRSFDYASVAAVRQLAEARPAAEPRMLQLAEAWRQRAVDGFRAAYRKAMRGCAAYPASKKQARAMMAFFTLEKAVYEVSYELANRPGWVDIPAERHPRHLGAGRRGPSVLRRPDPQVAAIVEARHGDPFAFLGMHKTPARDIRPGDAAGCAGSGGGRMRRPARLPPRLSQVHPRRFLRREHPRPQGAVSLSAARVERWRRSTNSTTSIVFRRCSASSTFICSPRATISRATASSARIRSSMRASRGSPSRYGRRMRSRVSVVGDFNAWDGRRMPMRRRMPAGSGSFSCPGLRPGHLYKYEILGADGQLLPLKADPHAEQTERPPNTASIVAEPSRHVWQDGRWMAERWRRATIARRRSRSTRSISARGAATWPRTGGI